LEKVVLIVATRYWDFNRDSRLPDVVQEESLNITVPGDSKGEKKIVLLEHNPFYSYKFTSDYAWKIVADEMGWGQWKVRRTPAFHSFTADVLVAQDENWVQESKRCPDENGVSRPIIANAQMQTVGDDYKERAYSMLTSVHDFAEFTTQGTPLRFSGWT
jgi:hypothetical protein